MVAVVRRFAAALALGVRSRHRSAATRHRPRSAAIEMKRRRKPSSLPRRRPPLRPKMTPRRIGSCRGGARIVGSRHPAERRRTKRHSSTAHSRRYGSRRIMASTLRATTLEYRLMLSPPKHSSTYCSNRSGRSLRTFISCLQNCKLFRP